MKILVFSWRDPKHPLAGGAEQVMHEHMKGWIRAGHEVTLFSSRFAHLLTNQVLDRVVIKRAGSQYLGVQLEACWFYLQHANDYDLVVDQFHGIPFFTPLYVRRPILAVIQETARKVWFLNPLPWPLNILVGIVGFFSEPLIFLLYKNVPFMTGSDSAKADLARFGINSANITVVPHGVIVQKPHPLPQKQTVWTIVYLGVLSKDKGIEEALRCFRILKNHGRFNFWVIGRPETASYGWKIDRLTKELKLTSQVRFWGFVKQRKKFQLLARAHLLVNPSIREGWGLVNIEANSLGTPVVAYNSLGLVDSVKDGVSGVLCQSNTPEELAREVVKIVNNPGLYQRLQQGAKSWARRFSWKVSVNLSLRLIERLPSDEI